MNRGANFYCLAGAVGESDLETFAAGDLLDEMASWSAQIGHDPDVLRAVKTIETQPEFERDDLLESAQTTPRSEAPSRGPRP